MSLGQTANRTHGNARSGVRNLSMEQGLALYYRPVGRLHPPSVQSKRGDSAAADFIGQLPADGDLTQSSREQFR